MYIRKYQLGEEDELMAVFYSSIHLNATSYYTKEQLNAWAPENMAIDKWKVRMEQINPFVLVDDNRILAYGDLQDNGYIDHFFVRGGENGKGYGGHLMTFLIELAKEKGIQMMTSDVSLAAQDFYSKFGFTIEKRQSVDVRGILTMENALMKLVL